MPHSKQTFHLSTDKTWNGKVTTLSEKASLTVSITPSELRIQLKAPFHNDPAPPGPKGECEKLWCYEVVELFLLGDSGHYLEVELGPHDHYLIYHLSGIRQISANLTPLSYKAEISGSSWQSSTTVDLKDLGIGSWQSVNAYAMHGQGKQRRYLAAFPVPGDTPDFHQPHYFRSLTEL